MIKVKHLKRKNPKDEEFLELIKVKRTLTNNLYCYYIYYRNEQIGLFIIEKGSNYIHEMEIFEDKYKRRGLATFMHDYIENDLRIKLITSNALSKAGERFYQAREKLKKKNPTDVYRTNTNVVDSTGIDKEYRRKGINTWLYDYIEKDQKIKLIPSNTLMREGMLFWRNRLKRKNPTDEEFLKKIRIEKTKFRPFDKTEDLYQIIYDNKNIGYALYDPISRTIEDISVQEEFRQKGIATLLHDYIEKDLRIILKPNSTQTWYGKAFWENRLKKTPNPKNKNARTLKTSKTKISR